MTDDLHKTMSFESLRTGYSGEALLQDASGSVNAGELVALAGRNGTGKSTLLRVLAGLQDPLEGEVRINGIPVQEIARQKRAKKISFVSTGLTSGEDLCVQEMVALGRYPHTGWWGRLGLKDREIIDNALESVNMSSFTRRKIHRLSDGERQRVMIARALAQDGDVLILDEPTAFLDLPNKFEMIHLLFQLSRKNKAIIYSTHDIEAAWSYSDKLWIIHERKFHEGSPEDIGLSGLYNELFRNSPVKLDSRTLRFSPDRKVTGEIQLEGEDKEVLRWTKMALLRGGFNITGNTGTDMLVRCIRDSSAIYWQTYSSDEARQFDSLYTLLLYLTGQK